MSQQRNRRALAQRFPHQPPPVSDSSAAVQKPDTNAEPRIIQLFNLPKPAPIVFGIPGLPNAQEGFTAAAKLGFTEAAWEDFKRWVRSTSGLRRQFLLGGNDINISYVIRDWELCGGHMDFSTLRVRHGKNPHPKPGSPAVCNTNQAAFNVVTGWIVERGGLDAVKARSIIEEHCPERLPEADDIWQKAFEITMAVDDPPDTGFPHFGIHR